MNTKIFIAIFLILLVVLTGCSSSTSGGGNQQPPKKCKCVTLYHIVVDCDCPPESSPSGG